MRCDVETILVDGYVWLEEGRPGLGGALFASVRLPVIGVAKTRFRGANAVEVLRGQSHSPLYITAAVLTAEAGAAFVRTLAAVPGVALVGIGPLLGVFQRDRRALHDLVAGTAVVNDWAPRPVELPPGPSRSLLRASLP